MRRTAFAVWVALLGLGFQTQARAQTVVGLDAVHGFTPADRLVDTRYDALRAEIDALGFSWEPLAAFDAPSLLGIDIVLLKIPYPDQPDEDDFSATEIEALQDFVTAGGALLVIGDAGSGSSVTGLNLVLAPFEIGISESLFFLNLPITLTHSQLVSNRIFDGVGSIQMLGFRFLAFPLNSTAEDLTLGSTDVIGVNAVNRKVMVIGDSSLWKDDEDGNPDLGVLVTIETGDNRALLVNALHWLARLPQPLPALSPLAVGFAAFGVLAASAALLRRPASRPRRG